MIKKTLDYLLFSGLSAVLGFLAVVYMTRNISVEEFGIIGLFMAIVFILPHLISFSSLGLVSINKVNYSSPDFMRFSGFYFVFGIINFFIIFIISLVMSLFFSDTFFLIFLLLPILAFFQFFRDFHHAELIQEGYSKKYGIYRLLLTLVSLLLTVLFISIYKLTWDGRLYALVLAELAILILSYKLSFTTLRKTKLKFNPNKFKEFAGFGLPLFIGLGAGWILNQADRFIVLEFFTLKDVGIYTAAYSIGTIVNLINQAATNAVVPKLYESFSKKTGHTIIKKLNLYYSVVILLISFMIGVGSFWYAPLLFGEAYADSPYIILVISLAFAFNGIYRTSGGAIAYYKKNKLQMTLLYFSAIINLVVSIILIPISGILSPAIGTLVAFFFLAVLSYHYAWKTLKEEENV